jgi:hypothetical protein
LLAVAVVVALVKVVVVEQAGIVALFLERLQAEAQRQKVHYLLYLGNHTWLLLVAAALVEAPMVQQVLMVTHLCLQLLLQLVVVEVVLELLLVFLVVLVAVAVVQMVGLELLVKDSVEETRRVLVVATIPTLGVPLVAVELVVRVLMVGLTLAAELVGQGQPLLLLGLQ